MILEDIEELNRLNTQSAQKRQEIEKNIKGVIEKHFGRDVGFVNVNGRDYYAVLTTHNLKLPDLNFNAVTAAQNELEAVNSSADVDGNKLKITFNFR